MAKLILYTELQFNGVAANPTTGIKAAITPKKFLTISDVTGASPAQSEIKYGRHENSRPDVIRASGSVSSLNTAINAATTTDVHKLLLPIVDQITGAIANQNVIVDNIHRVQADPDNSAQSYIFLENPTLTGFDVLRASLTVASVVTLSNA